MTRLAATLLLFLLGSAGSASAQIGTPEEIWSITRDREGDALMATAAFSNGITLISRCSYHNLSLIVAGLPPAPESPETSRRLTFLVDDDVNDAPLNWTVASDRTAAFSRLPGPLTRRLAKGGSLQIVIPAPPGGRRTRYVMELTQSASVIQQVLAHCGKPSEDEDDARILGDAGTGLPPQLTWERRATPDYPAATVHGAFNWGTATVSCAIRPDGRLTDCNVESEFPEGAGFGSSARRAASQSRVQLTDEARAAGEAINPEMRVAFSVHFRMAQN